MTARPAARIGDSWEQIETPALVVELDALEANIARMAEFVRSAGIALRPHAKTHRCPAVARLQIAHGAVGICCQTVSEAEAMAEGGIGDILVSNEVVGAGKLARLAILARRVRVAVCADDPAHVAALEAAAREHGTRLRVLVEIDVGSRRCGVAPGAEAVALAQRIAASAHLEFAGLQAYHGRAQHLRAWEDRRQTIAGAAEAVRLTLDLLAEAGLKAEIVGGAGTGTYAFEAASGVYNELQAGSYVFMDRDYALNQGAEGANDPGFAHSLFLKTSVISRPGPDRIVTDAGLKVYTTDAGPPALAGFEGVEIIGCADEHTNIRFRDPGARPAVGAAVRLIPGHCDPTVNLHDWIVGVRGGRVECVWPVAARGASA